MSLFKSIWSKLFDSKPQQAEPIQAPPVVVMEVVESIPNPKLLPEPQVLYKEDPVYSDEDVQDIKAAMDMIRVAERRESDPEYLAKWKGYHRKHQHDAIKSITQNLGQINMPTGTGKTRVQTDIHLTEMFEHPADTRVCVISSHRLLLNKNLISAIIEVAAMCGLSFDVLFVGSDNVDDAEIFMLHEDLNIGNTRVTATTSSDKIKEAYDQAKQQCRHLLVVSTYHSIAKLSALPFIHVVTYDESHTTVTKDFKEAIASIKHLAQREYFFTATRRVGVGSDLGQDDVDFYGPVLYELSPRAAIDLGEIVPPRLHIIKEKNDKKYKGAIPLVRTLMEGYDQHQSMIGKSLTAKMLVSCSGSDDMAIILGNDKIKDWAAKNNVAVISFSSVIGYTLNFETVNRNTAFNAMMSLGDDDKAILLHLDILTEGIDLPGITGTMIMRGLGDAKFLQTLGRVARLHRDDRSGVYSRSLMPGDYKNWVKPYAWVILPNDYDSFTTGDALAGFLKVLLRTYDLPIESFVPEEYFMTDTDAMPLGITEKDLDTGRTVRMTLEHVIVDVYNAEIESIEDVSLFLGSNNVLDRIHDDT